MIANNGRDNDPRKIPQKNKDRAVPHAGNIKGKLVTLIEDHNINKVLETTTKKAKDLHKCKSSQKIVILS